MKVLLIEDNIRLAERVSYHLRKDFIVELAQSGKEGKEKAHAGQYAIILLDLHLPDVHGFEICKQLRSEGIIAPILVLSGDRELNSRVSLLEGGADDFLIKPFHPNELLARIHALMRRNVQTYDQHILSIKDLTIDVNRRHVERAGTPISLRRKEFDILEYLVHNKGRALTRTMILNHVWEDAKESWHNTVDVHIKYLRDKVDRPFDSPLIKTAYGVGYMVDDTP